MFLSGIKISDLLPERHDVEDYNAKCIIIWYSMIVKYGPMHIIHQPHPV